MAYGVYFREKGNRNFMRTCEYRKNRKGFTAAYDIRYETREAAEAKVAELIERGFEAKIKEVK